MSDNIHAYPLKWPTQVPRTHANQRGTFDGTPGHIYGELLKAIDKLSLKNRSRTHTIRHAVVISSNARLNRDGSANANDLDRAGLDAGAAVYFPIDGVTTCIAIDRYDRIWKNLRAIQRTLEAFHFIERHGGSGLLKQAFTGFAALPAPGEATARTCWQVLGIAPTASQAAIDGAWRERAKVCHPDRPGGSHDAMTELNTARDQASQQATQP